MAERGWMPDLVLCSTAARAKQTWDAVATELKTGPQVTLLEDLYGEDAAGYVRIIKSSGAQSSLMVIGHNPMMEDVALGLAAPDDALAEQIRRSGFPTAGLVIIDFEEDITGIEAGRGRIVEIHSPAAR
jgi:phosphohistidine phosphatase